MVEDIPVLVDQREESIHLIWDHFEMWRQVVTNVDWLLAVTPAELSDIRHCGSIQGPKGVFIKSLNTLFKADLDAIQQQVVLTQEILFLDSCIQIRIVAFSYAHFRADLPFCRDHLTDARSLML